MQFEIQSKILRIDDFDKIDFIGKGAYGEVRKVQFRDTGEVYALKKIKYTRGREIPVSALREIDFLRKIQHENIVKLTGVVRGRREDKIYLLIEYCETDLAQILENIFEPFPQPQIKCIMMQLLSALNVIHGHGIIHRDINPSNILIKSDSIIKVCDFGLASEKSSKRLTPAAGTLWYQAPELLFGSESYDTAVDIWSLGCVFAELLTVEALFPGESELEQINMIINLLGTPNEETMPGFNELPHLKYFDLIIQPNNHLEKKFADSNCDVGIKLLQEMLKFGPSLRITACKCLKSEYMSEEPLACSIQALKDYISAKNRPK